MRRRRGFSLVELMVVVAIIGMLAAAVTVGVLSAGVTAKRTRVASDFEQIGAASKMFKMQTGRWPQRLDELQKKGLLEKEAKDPWGNPYAYSVVGSSYSLASHGADGRPGGVDEDLDITTENVEKVLGQD